MITSAEEFRDRVFQIAAYEDDPYKVTRLALDELETASEWRVVAELTAGKWVKDLLSTALPPAEKRSGTAKTYRDAQGNKRASSKQVQFLSWWERRIAVKINTPGGAKTLGQCTAEDLDWIAKLRDQKAAEDMAAAARYRKLADVLRDQKLTIVAEVDAATGRDILGD